jgi:hypothetical protein
MWPSLALSMLALCSGMVNRVQDHPGLRAPAPECASQEQRWDRLQYLGGAIDLPALPASRLSPKSYWKNTLVISCQLIRLQVGNRGLVEFAPSRITGIVYAGQKGENATAIGIGALTGGILGMLLAAQASSVSHYIAIEYTLNDGRKTGVLLQADKKNFDAILSALKAVTNLPPSKFPPSPSAEAPGASISVHP